MSDIGVVLLLLKDHPPGLCALPRDQAGVDGKLKWKVGSEGQTPIRGGDEMGWTGQGKGNWMQLGSRERYGGTRSHMFTIFIIFVERIIYRG